MHEVLLYIVVVCFRRSHSGRGALNSRRAQFSLRCPYYPKRAERADIVVAS